MNRRTQKQQSAIAQPREREFPALGATLRKITLQDELFLFPRGGVRVLDDAFLRDLAARGGEAPMSLDAASAVAAEFLKAAFILSRPAKETFRLLNAGGADALSAAVFDWAGSFPPDAAAREEFQAMIRFVAEGVAEIAAAAFTAAAGSADAKPSEKNASSPAEKPL